jgi:hypothetical protein
MSLSPEQEAAFSRPAPGDRWFRRLFVLLGGREGEAISVVHSADDADIFDGFHWPERAGPLSKPELLMMSFLVPGM